MEDIPNYQEFRKETLQLIPRVAHLPPDTLKKYESKRHSFDKGWSTPLKKNQNAFYFGRGSYVFDAGSDDPLVVNP